MFLYLFILVQLLSLSHPYFCSVSRYRMFIIVGLSDKINQQNVRSTVQNFFFLKDMGVDLNTDGDRAHNSMHFRQTVKKKTKKGTNLYLYIMFQSIKSKSLDRGSI